MSAVEEAGVALELDHVHRRYGDVSAIRDLSFRVGRGEKVGLLGINGAGKTTTIRLLMGLEQPTEGRVRSLGLDPWRCGAACKSRIGYVPEAHHMHRWMRVEQVLRLCRGLFPRWDDERAEQLLRRYELPPRARTASLSKGMRAKLSLVLALSHRPELLILDEPTSGLDPIVREDFLEGVLQTLCDAAVTVLFSSHILSDVERLAERILIIHEGRLLADRATDELLARTKRIRAVLADTAAPRECPQGMIWQSIERREWQLTIADYSTDVVERLRARNAIANLDVADLSLEEIFKDYVRGRNVTS